MSRSLQDQFIDDDEEEVCPLCVEEFDLQDKGFRPCPCGYQICQFCYHNVKTNMNGLCPACRRPYCDDDIKYKVITPEETAAHKARQAQKQKKTQQALQKEKQKAEADHLSRKHLAGMRVVQKNLVYVTGLSPTTQEEELLQTLRGDQYFGQYGKIIKIVVSKAKDTPHPHSVGVYVTYDEKDDAANCIAAVDGSKNGERTLRAQYGTTKYCSAYLRGDTCTNRNCMFLHEPGEANESYSRADLSALNAGSSQHGHGRAPPPQSQQPVASATQAMARQSSNDNNPSSPKPERPALPSTASWASKPSQPSRTEGRPLSVTSGTPENVDATPANVVSESELGSTASQPAAEPVSEHAIQNAPMTTRGRHLSPWSAMLINLKVENFRLVWSSACLPQADLDVINNYPPLFDQNGGARMRQRRQREEEQRRLEQEAQAFQQPPTLEQEDNPEMSGSLQLGGEPEERQNVSQVQSAIRSPGQDGVLDQRFQFGGGSGSSPGISERGMTPQQHQQMLLQTLKPDAASAYASQSANFQPFQPQSNQPLGHQRNVSRYSFANDSSASAAVKPVGNPKLLSQQSSMMPQTSGNHFSTQHQQPQGQFYTSNVQGPPPGLKTTGTPPVSGNLTFGQGHGFATGGLQYGASASRNQQDSYYRELLRGRDAAGSVDAKRELHSFQNYSGAHSNTAYPLGQPNAFPAASYASLSAFGDGEKQRKKKGKKHRHANTSSSSGGGVVDVPSDHNANHLLQARLHQGGGGIGRSTFAGQSGAAVDADFPPLGPPKQHGVAGRVSVDESRRSTPPVPPGFEGQAANESRRSTPTVPPGLSKPSALPDLEGSIRPISRPNSRASLRRTASQIFPAVPLRPGTPAKATTSGRHAKGELDIAMPEETPTKPSRTTASSDLKNAISIQEDLTGSSQQGDPTKDSQAATADPEDPSAIASKAAQLAEDGSTSAKPTLPQQDPQTGSPNMQHLTEDEAAAHMNDARSSPKNLTKLDSKSNAQKRNHPGKLDITAAMNKQEEALPDEVPGSVTDVATPSNSPRGSSPGPSSSRMPESPSLASPAVKTVPRTLRVVQTPTPKAEAASQTFGTVAVHPLPSRQPSIASINPPGTPSSEQISMSDNISMTSTSLSRANSPPPAGNKAGSAPLRPKTKNQMKKERQERAKALQEEKAKADEPVKVSADEPAQEAIVSRKKKTKKEKESRPAKTRSASTATDILSAAKQPETPSVNQPAQTPNKIEETIAVDKETRAASPAEPSPPNPPPAVHSPADNPSPPPTPTLTAAQLIAELKASAPDIQKCIDSLFRVSNSHHFKTSSNVSHKDLLNSWSHDFNLRLSKDEIDALIAGKVPAVYRGGHGGQSFDRHVVSPGGAHLRALTQELETRFLELERALRDMPDELRFRPAKPQNEMRLPAFDLAELKRRADHAAGRGVSAMEQMVQDGSAMKKGAFLVDEASRYINEFVMPPVTPPQQPHPATARQQQMQQQQQQQQQQLAENGPIAHGPNVAAAAAAAIAGNPSLAVTAGAGGASVVPSVETAERHLNEMRKVVEERESALRKLIKKNKKLMGLS